PGPPPPLHPPAPATPVARPRRRRVRPHARRGKRLPERLTRGRRAVAGEGEAVLGTPGVDHLARNHLTVALLSPVPAAHVAAIEPDHDGAGRLRRGSRRGPGGGVLGDPRRVPHAA